jgi:hypothetical protein
MLDTIQQGMAVRSANVPDERMVVFRIGINLGDVIIEGDDIYGDGVNVAARLQELAEPGGVFVPVRYSSKLTERLIGVSSIWAISGLRRQLGPFYSDTGRPSVDPELMIRMLLVGYCYGIRSEPRLCEEISLNLAYRWFCRLGLED